MRKILVQLFSAFIGIFEMVDGLTRILTFGFWSTSLYPKFCLKFLQFKFNEQFKFNDKEEEV